MERLYEDHLENIIDDWLTKHGDLAIDKQVEEEALYLTLKSKQFPPLSTKKVMGLITMTDFVLRQNYIWQIQTRKEGDLNFIMSTSRYAQFLKQPLTLGMFVPCDLKGNVLNESDKYLSCTKGLEYGKAKERVLFEGLICEKVGDAYLITDKFENNIWASWNTSKTVEDLLHLNLELTKTATIVLGL